MAEYTPSTDLKPDDTAATPAEFTGSLATPRRFYRQWMLAGNPANFISRLVEDHGDFVHYRGLIDFYLVNHPSLVRQVLKDTMRDFDKNTIIYNHFAKVFGRGLVTAEGEAWKRKRKMMQPMFSSASIKAYFGLMVEAAESATHDWEEGRVFDIAEEMNYLTLEIAGRSFFSNGFDGAGSRIRKWTEAINRYSAKPPLPVVSDLRFPSPTNLRLRRMLEDFHQFMRDIILQRKDEAPKEDLLQVLLSARDEDGEKLEEDEVCEEILGLIVGGHETSATALTWLWYELHHHPEVEAKMVEEIRSVVGDGPVEMEHLCRLRYTNMVFQEVMRLHPPFWFENRSAMKDIELGGAVIPKGSMVVLSRYSLHRHPDFWPDPETFDPSRFDPENPQNPEKSCAHIPFSSGPRVCIGRHFAMMELLVIAVTILRDYRVSVHSSDRHQVSVNLTMSPRNGLIVTTAKRS